MCETEREERESVGGVGERGERECNFLSLFCSQGSVSV